jgi:rhodanese-related sulfurtransferase
MRRHGGRANVKREGLDFAGRRHIVGSEYEWSAPMIRRRVLLALPLLLSALPARAWEEADLPDSALTGEGALVVDIRTPEEWAETGVLPGAERLTFTDPESFAADFLATFGAEIAAGREVVLVCRSGRRSAAAAEALSQRVVNRVVSQAGGMNVLLARGVPVTAP